MVQTLPQSWTASEPESASRFMVSACSDAAVCFRKSTVLAHTPHTQEDHVGLKVTPFEWVLLCHDAFLLFFSPHCNRSASFLQHNLDFCPSRCYMVWDFKGG